MSETCPVEMPVKGGAFKTPSTRVCGRPVKADGLCGYHLAAKERRERNERIRRQKHQAGLR